MNDLDQASTDPSASKWKEIVSDAIRFWERMRLVYCGVLTLIVLYFFFRIWPVSAAQLQLKIFLMLFLLAVLAFLIGMAFAAIVTRFMVLDLFIDRKG